MPLRLARVLTLLLALAGVALIAADPRAPDAQSVPRVTPHGDPNPDLAIARDWDSPPRFPRPNIRGTTRPSFTSALNFLFDWSPLDGIDFSAHANWAALARVGLASDSPVPPAPATGTVRQRFEAFLATADPAGRLAYVRDGLRITITTRDDLAAAADMRAQRAAAPEPIRRILDAPVPLADIDGLPVAPALRRIARIYGLRIDADWQALEQTYIASRSEAFRDTDVGALIDHLLRHAPGPVPLRYRVERDGLRVVPAEAQP